MCAADEVTDVNPVADGVGDMTPEWLSHALDREVFAVRAERIGTGQTGAAYRLEVEGDGGPSSFVAKVAAGDGAARRRVRQGYRSEVGFYTHLVDTLDVATPRCWYAAITDDGTAFTLVLDDLTPRVPGVQAAGCSPEQAAAAVENLVGLHAPRWGDASLFDHRFLARPTEEGAAFAAKVAAAATEEFVTRYGGDLDAADVATLRAAAAATEAWQLTGREPFTVLHGDYRLDNLLFPPEGDEVVAIDWQTLAVGPAGRDLGYFLGTCLGADDRRAVEHDLLAGYHAALLARGVEGYDLSQCIDDYRRGQLQGPFVTTVGCVYATGERSGAADAMFLAMARRSCAAIRDLDSLELVT